MEDSSQAQILIIPPYNLESVNQASSFLQQDFSNHGR